MIIKGKHRCYITGQFTNFLIDQGLCNSDWLLRTKISTEYVRKWQRRNLRDENVCTVTFILEIKDLALQSAPC